VIPATLDNAIQGELQMYENNYKALNLITTVLGRNVYDRVSHLELLTISSLSCAIHMRCLLRLNQHVEILTIGSIKLSHKPGESLDDCFACFESIVSSLCSCGALAYSDNERAKQLLYALDDSVWGMKITVLEESTDFATLDPEKLFSKLKSHELSRKGCLNHDASQFSKALISSARVGGHDSNPTNTTDSSSLEFTLFSLAASSDEQYESITDDEMTLLVRKFRALHRFCKERRRSPRGCFESGDTAHFITDCPKQKKLDYSSNKYDYTKRNDYGKGDDKKKYRFRDKKKKFQKMMS
jgi:hypothetical protein